MRSASRLLLIGRSVWLCLTAVLALAVASTPAVSAPVVAGFSVTVYATATDPMNMSFALDGALHIGRDNIGSGGDFGDAVKVSKIAAGGGTAQEFGESSIADPDSVLVDRHGLISGTIGSVLVGGGAGPVSYTHLDVYKRQAPCWRATRRTASASSAGPRCSAGVLTRSRVLAIAAAMIKARCVTLRLARCRRCLLYTSRCV